MAGSLVLALGTAVVGGPLAERLLVTAVVMVFSFGALSWLRRCSGVQWPVVALCAPPLALNVTVFLGFYSFGLGFAAVPWVWSLAATGKWWRAGVLAAVAWSCHVVPAAFCALGLVLEGAAAVRRSQRWRDALGAALASIPTVLLTALWGGPSGEGEWVWLDLASRAERLFTLGCAAPFTGTGEWAALALAVVLAQRGVVGARRGGASWLLLRVGLLSGLALAAPEGGPGFWYVGDRLALGMWLAWVGVASTAPGDGRNGVLCAVASLALLSQSVLGVRALQDELSAVDALARRVPERSTVVMLSYGTPIASRFDPMVHAIGRVAAERGLVDLSNHEAETDHFQVKYRSWVRPLGARNLIGRAHEIDLDVLAKRAQFIVACGTPEDTAALARRFTLVDRSDGCWVFSSVTASRPGAHGGADSTL